MAQQHDTRGAAKPQANSPEQQYRDKEASFEENAKKRSIGFNRYPLIKTYINTFFHHAICVSRLPVFHWRLYGQQSNWLATISDNQCCHGGLFSWSRDKRITCNRGMWKQRVFNDTKKMKNATAFHSYSMSLSFFARLKSL